MKKMIFSGCALALSGLSTLALAHGGATGIVKERMDGMLAMSKVVKSLSVMMRGDIQYNADKVREGARLIQSHAGEALTKLFPEGAESHGSEAKPEIWSDWGSFSDYAERLALYSEGLEVVADKGLMHENGSMTMGSQSSMLSGSDMAGNGMMGDDTTVMDTDQLAQMSVDSVFNMVTQTCSACHTQFRAER